MRNRSFIFAFLLFLLLFTVFPKASSAEIITNYSFEDWTGFNNSDSPAVGYIFTSPGLAPSGWTEHINSTIVTTGGASCDNNTAFDGSYYQHVQFSSNHIDTCLGGTSQTTNVRDYIGANYVLPNGVRDNTHYGDVMMGDTAVLRFYFRVTDDWSSDINDVVDGGGGMKFIRWAIGNDSVGDDNNVLIKARFDDSQEFPRIGIFNRGDNKMTYGSHTVNWQDGQWHSFALKSIRTAPTTFDISIYLDDWNMVTPFATKTTIVPDAGNGGYYRLSLAANWSGVTNIPNLIGMDFDKIEVWNSLPDISTEPTVVNISDDTMINGQSINIDGYSFGVHSNNNERNYTYKGITPINTLFKDFEDGLIESQNVIVENGYRNEWSIGQEANENRGYYGIRDYVATRLATLSYTQSTASTGWLYSTFYMRVKGGIVSAGKPFRWYFGDTSNMNNMYMGVFGTSFASSANGAFTFHSEASNSTGDYYSFIPGQEGNWNRISIEAHYTAPGTGIFKFYVNGVLQEDGHGNSIQTDYFENTTVFFPNGHTVNWGYIDNDHGDNTLLWNYDDLYLDYTLARVELCDISIWDITTPRHCEVQPLASWTDSSVNIILNQGSFNEGDTAYLYVIDENGNVNTNGYPVTISSNNQIIRSDTNQDQTINTTDALLVLRNSLGLDMTSTSWQDSITTGDADCDGNSNSTDAMLILRYSLGLSMSGTLWCE